MEKELEGILYLLDRFIKAAKEGIPVITKDIFNCNNFGWHGK